MNPMPALEPALKQLRLSGILDSMEIRNKQAIEDGLSHVEFLAMLIQDEVARREQKKFSLRVRRAGFRSEKTLESFDFSYNPSINKALVLDLATCRFLEEKAPVLIVGPCGTGKSHIAQALGHAAARKGYEVLFTPVSKLLGMLQAAKATNSYDRKLSALAKTGHVRQRGVNSGVLEVAIGQAALGGIWAGCASLGWVLSSAMASTCM